MWSVLFALAYLALGEDCDSAGGYDLAGFRDNTYKYEWSTGAYVVISLCGTINTSCGISGGCTAPDCCAFCQLWTSDGQTDGACLGKNFAGSVPISGGIQMKYTGGDPVASPPGPREGFVDVICDSSTLFSPSGFVQAQPNNPGPDGAYAYNLTVKTSAVCSGGAGGLGGGGVFLIILFCVVLPVYLIGGVCWNKFKEQKEGVELIPNYEFWAASPGYFLAGCTFTKDKILGLCGRSGYDTVA
eukprot:TRINITY_DN10353_c0_g1_i1.p1 TRINITY_DN10353_c0_g1~~TRINITY_DN10353_c0_g1_i1.p1  ORF type:complete len:243 (-),score=62.48 TRINITY_DN10353_c0_g1_i1:37-765(-)